MSNEQTFKIHKKLEWLTEYINASVEFIGEENFKKLKSVTYYKIPNTKLSHQYACIWDREGIYEIMICLTANRIAKIKDKYYMRVSEFTKITLLNHLAHEIAHIVHWEHTPEHKILENEICSKFMHMLSQTGYKNEDKEPIKKRNFLIVK
jgi:hypothetical protein